MFKDEFYVFKTTTVNQIVLRICDELVDFLRGRGHFPSVALLSSFFSLLFPKWFLEFCKYDTCTGKHTKWTLLIGKDCN